MKAPLRWGRLPALENLIGSASDVLNNTTKLSIEVQQEPTVSKQCDDSGDDADSDSSDDVPASRMIYFPRGRLRKT